MYMEKELLYRFFDGRATTEEESRILDWVDAAPAHRQELLAERRLFDAALMLARPEKPHRRLFVLPRWTREVMKYAAAILVTAGLGGAYVSHMHRELMQGGNTITVPAGQRVNIVLPDGTKVCMNALSELKCPAVFAGKTRRVQLKGEAFFDVTHDADHPFIVETYAYDVEVLGTKFDVEARAEVNEFSTSLVEGKVRVTDRNAVESPVLLAPNERVERIAGKLSHGRIPEHEQFQWRDGLIAFRDASFAELIGDFEKYYGVKIEVQRAQLPQNLFTGKIRISEGIDHALWILQRNSDFRYSRNATKDVITIY